ncbi:MAG: transglycosylase SLT domain-containing protein [Nitrospirae bacterium]|uniref:lytic transglycosylase domain-containing protein n=1 Tax=Candidatus Magnetobacterium casense TaxID=1455061 RepID=UPI0009DCE0F6|nr:transglycosylase SLT domain-containing protein [Candidatus Magnetobacterium casensis]MBF0338714.1 transglycosylase SLT domain-containing protein [Nitrospirota bacterium]
MRIVRLIVIAIIAATLMLPINGHALFYGAEKKEENKTTNGLPYEKIPHRTIKENSPVSQHSNSVQIEHSVNINAADSPADADGTDMGAMFRRLGNDPPEDSGLIIGRLTDTPQDMTLLTTALPTLGASDISAEGHHSLDGKARAVVEEYLVYFSKKVKSTFSQWLTRGSRYVPVMKQVLQEHNVPGDLVYLPLIESGFNLFARSNSHAVGPWQLMASTAKRLNLKINYWVDERHDPIKSTMAASRYLKFLFEKFGSWDLAIAAYNAGELNIENALRRSNTTSFWKLFGSTHIPKETRQFVPKFLAAREIGQTPDKYGLDDVDVRTPFTFDVVVISPPATLEFVAKAAGTTVEKIRELNPEIRQWCIPPYMQKYRLRIPVGKKDSFLAAYNAASDGERYPLGSYTTVKGDTLSTIARKARVQADILRDLNRLSSNGTLNPGMVIYLPPNTTITKIDDKHQTDKIHAKHKNLKKTQLNAKTPTHKSKINAKTTVQKTKIKAKTKNPASGKIVKIHNKTTIQTKTSAKQHKRT